MVIKGPTGELGETQKPNEDEETAYKDQKYTMKKASSGSFGED